MIIGFSNSDRYEKKLNSSEKFFKIVKQINPYLLEAPDIVVEGLPKSLCDVFEMETGTRIGAQQYVFKENEKELFEKKSLLQQNTFMNI